MDQQTIQQLLQRIDQLEARVAQLEAQEEVTALKSAMPPSKAADPPASKATDVNPILHSGFSQAHATFPVTAHPAGEPERAPSENDMNDRMDLSRTLLRIRGFGDVSLHRPRSILHARQLENSCLEPLIPQHKTVSVPRQNLQSAAPPRTEDEQSVAQRIPADDSSHPLRRPRSLQNPNTLCPLWHCSATSPRRFAHASVLRCLIPRECNVALHCTR